MPAKSKKQQEFFGMVVAGKAQLPIGMTMEEARKFAQTARAGLPERARPKKKARKR